MGLFSGMSGVKRNVRRPQSLVGDWKSKNFRLGSYVLELTNIVAGETRQDQPKLVFEFEVKEVLRDEKNAFAVGDAVSVAYVLERTPKGNLSDKGTKAMARALATLEAVAGLDAGTIDPEDESAETLCEELVHPSDEDESLVGQLVKCNVTSRQLDDGGQWVQPYFDALKD